jgi:hypothetical protein
MKNIKIIIFILAIIVAFNQLSAQTTITNNPEFNNRAYLRIGIEPATMITFGFERQFNLSFINKDIVTFAEVSSSTSSFENNEFKIGGLLPILEPGNFKVLGNLNFSTGRLSAKNFDSRKFAAAIKLSFGLYKQKWFAAFTTEYENIFLTKIEHSDFYRDTYYEDAVDGWYKGSGGMFQFGIEGGYTFMKRIDAHVELKLPFTEKFNSYGGSPMHVNLGIGYKF